MQEVKMNHPQIPHNPTQLINHASRVFTRIMEARLRRIGLGIGQMPVLAALKEGNSLQQKDLARLARIEQPSMAAILKRMERDGLVKRMENPRDMRSQTIALTPKAMERLPEARKIVMQGNTEAIAGLSPEEIEALTRLLEKVNDNLSRITDTMPSL